MIPRDFPELALLAWNRDPARPIPAEEALGLYETNWRHLDVARLGPDETALIEALTAEYGRGSLLAIGGRTRSGRKHAEIRPVVFERAEHRIIAEALGAMNALQMGPDDVAASVDRLRKAAGATWPDLVIEPPDTMDEPKDV